MLFQPEALRLPSPSRYVSTPVLLPEIVAASSRRLSCISEERFSPAGVARKSSTASGVNVARSHAETFSAPPKRLLPPVFISSSNTFFPLRSVPVVA